MADPNWNNGFYYDGLPPHTGMKLARRESVCTISFKYLLMFEFQRLRPSRIVLAPSGISVLEGSFVKLQSQLRRNSDRIECPLYAQTF